MDDIQSQNEDVLRSPRKSTKAAEPRRVLVKC